MQEVQKVQEVQEVCRRGRSWKGRFCRHNRRWVKVEVAVWLAGSSVRLPLLRKACGRNGHVH